MVTTYTGETPTLALSLPRDIGDILDSRAGTTTCAIFDCKFCAKCQSNELL